ncbi:ATP synthase F1 subunit epsilon [Christensenellaceae bacterium 44-20]
MTFDLSIMTPERQFFSGQVEALTITGIDGQMTVLAGHAPMVVSLAVGEISIKQDGVWREAVNSEGFMEVLQDSVVVFVQACEWPEDIDMRRAEEAKHRAEERIRQRQSIWENKSSKIALARAMVRLRAGRKYH